MLLLGAALSVRENELHSCRQDGGNMVTLHTSCHRRLAMIFKFRGQTEMVGHVRREDGADDQLSQLLQQEVGSRLSLEAAQGVSTA